MLKMYEWGTHVRAGNQLFQVAGIIGLAEKYSTTFALPNHGHYNFFEHFNWRPNVDNSKEYDIQLNNPRWDYFPEYWDQHKEEIQTKICNLPLNMFFQSQLNWSHCEDLVLERLSFKEEYLDFIRTKYTEPLSKPTIAVSIRLNDFVGHGCFFQIPKEWFIKVVKEQFENWQDYNIIVFSDDVEKCKTFIQGKNIYFAEPNNTHINKYDSTAYHSNPMEQLAYMSLCDNFVVSNSTFSWWGAYLGSNRKNNTEGKVCHSGKVFRGKCAQDYNSKDYYHPSWIKVEI